jgi:hypothetical protein
MSTFIGGGVFTRVTTLQGETSVAALRANRCQGGRRTVGGRLHITSNRLIFTPHLLDAALGGVTWILDRTDVVDVSAEPRDGGALLGGGLRERLRIEAHGQEPELFVVNRLDQVLRTLREWLA